jgi:inorganic triphosphatase YgiF
LFAWRMFMAVETELKFRVPRADLTRLAEGKVPDGDIGDRSESRLVSTYFDTARHKLRRHGLSLRVRHDGRRHIQTIKRTSGAELGRGEWETEIGGPLPDLTKVGGTPLATLASKELSRKLKAIFETSVHRITLPICMNGSEIELAVDRGKLVAGRRSTLIEELELELKQGRPNDLFRLAKSVERNSAAELYLETKAERGYSLARGENPRAVYAEPIVLQREMSAGEAFRIIARSTLRHFAANADAVRARDPKGIHQMRVGLRRLRAAISLFSDLLPGERTEHIKAELKWLTNELAPARDLDVFVKRQIGHPANTLIPPREREAIEKEFAARQAEALEQAGNAVTSARTRILLLDIMEWLETGNVWSEGEAQTAIEAFAADIFRRRLKKIRKAGRHLEQLSTHDRHKFRIKIKKVRYAAQFFESLFRSKRDRKHLARLSNYFKQVQDALGKLNDFVEHRKLLEETAFRASTTDQHAQAFALGVVLGRENEAVKPLMKVAVKKVRRIRQVRF